MIEPMEHTFDCVVLRRRSRHTTPPRFCQGRRRRPQKSFCPASGLPSCQVLQRPPAAQAPPEAFPRPSPAYLQGLHPWGAASGRLRPPWVRTFFSTCTNRACSNCAGCRKELQFVYRCLTGGLTGCIIISMLMHMHSREEKHCREIGHYMSRRGRQADALTVYL